MIASIKNENLVKKNFPFRRTHIYLDILEVLSHSDYQDKNTIELATMTQAIIEENLKR